MTPERWRQLKSFFAEAVERAPAERESYLSTVARQDPGIAEELRRLLAESDRSEGFLETTLTLPPELLYRSSLSSGTVLLDRFEILRFIARGGMGEVYEAYDAALKERVALKTIRPEIASSRAAVERFKAEVSRARSIASDHVCRVYEFFTHFNPDGSEVNFLTMQLLMGESLSGRLRRHGRVEPGEALLLLKDLAAGLEAAHRKGVVHGDLKSGNIILVRRDDGALSAVITDFGLARRLRTGAAPGDLRSKSLAYGGTPKYMAPEQLAGCPATLASDVYSLGVVAFEMVAGALPPHGTTEPAFSRSLAREIPKSLDQVIFRCLEREPRRRCSAAALQRALEGEPARLGMPLISAIAAAVFVLLVTISIWIGRPPATSAAAPPEKSLAVLPFDESGAPPNARYFADGFTDELTSALTRVPDLHVVGEESSFRFRGSNLPPAEIGRKLGVRYLLRGAIRRSGGEVRAIARLINVATGFDQFSVEFTGNDRNVLQMQTRLAQQVAVAMQVKFAAAEPQDLRLLPGGGARDLYWMGRYFWRQRTDASVLRSLQFFKSAVQQDPNYALAYTGLADCYSVLAEGNVLPAAEALANARTAALRAVALDSTLADAYVSLGQVTSLYDRDFAQAEHYFRQALALSPNLILAHQWYSYLLVKQRRFPEAMQHAQKALANDPLSLPANINLAVQYFYAGNYDAAGQQCRKLDQLQPTLIFTHAMTALMLARERKFDDAFRVLELVRQRAPNHAMILRTLGEVNALAGRAADAGEAAANLIALRPAGGVPASYIAIVYATLGSKDLAFDWMEKAYAEFDAFLPMLDVYPAFESLRSDPRYADLALRLGLREKTGSGSAPPR